MSLIVYNSHCNQGNPSETNRKINRCIVIFCQVFFFLRFKENCRGFKQICSNKVAPSEKSASLKVTRDTTDAFLLTEKSILRGK